MSQHLLSGLKVIDCATVIAAPVAATMLADFGADVIKVEQPGSGDMLRMLSDIPITPNSGSDWFWQLGAHNKRSITLDLKDAAGIKILQQLIGEADVFITNHPYPVRQSLGITYPDIQKLNAEIIYASITAYGEQGAERDRKGFDQLAYWARSGMMELMREPGTRPSQGLPGMGDHPTAVALYAGIITALLHRERTGEGALVHTSLLANGLWSAAGVAQGAFAGGDMPAYRDANASYSAMYRPYQTQDKRWLQLNMVRDEELLSLTLAALDALHLLSDARFNTLEGMWENRAELGNEIQALVEQKPCADWVTIFSEFGVPVNVVANIEDALSDPQLKDNAMIVSTQDKEMNTRWLIKQPMQVSSVPQVEPTRAPGLGEHTEQILEDLGYSQDAIEQLRKQGTI